MTSKGSDDRYLVYLDILGFREMVRQRRVEEIYELLNKCVEELSYLEKSPVPFSRVHFSDTVVLWHESSGVSAKAFLQACLIGTSFYRALLANKVPVRGAISYGQFTVRPDVTGKVQLFFGKALIEAYEAEKKESWLGIVVCESAWKPCQKVVALDALGAIGMWRRRKTDRRESECKTDNVLALNPFYEALEEPVLRASDESLRQMCARVVGQHQTRANAVRAFRFLMDESLKYTRRGDFSGREAVKYHATLAFVRDVLGPEGFSQMEAESQQIAP